MSVGASTDNVTLGIGGFVGPGLSTMLNFGGVVG